MQQKDFEVSHHSATNSRLCWQKHKYIAVDKLVPKKRARPLTVGSIIHKCFDNFYLGKSKTDILQAVSTSYNSAISTADQMDVEDLIIDKYTCLGAFEFYPDDLSTFDQIEPEVEFRVKLWGHIFLVGRVDGLVHNVKNNTWWVREMKITSLTMQQLFARAQVSYQVSGYKLGVELLRSLSVAGCLYDAIKKPLLRKRTTEDAEAFGKRIQDDYRLTLKDPDKRLQYYARQEVWRNEFQMKCFKQDTIRLARDIQRKLKNNSFFRNPDACWSFNRVCEFEPICWNANPKSMMGLYDVKGQPSTSTDINVEDLPF